jgi:hypothetical protein
MPQKPAKQARRRVLGPDLRVSPLLAYGDGTSAESWKPPTPFAAGCIGVAAVLQAAARERSSTVREQMLDRAIDQMTALLGPEEAGRGSSINTAEPRGVLTPFFTAGDVLQIAEEAPPSLPGHMFESLAALIPADSVEGGRVLSGRIMFGYDDVHNDLRTELTRQLARLAFRLRNHELLCRAFAHLAGRAIVVGNLPQAEKAARRCARHAVADGDRRLLAMAANIRGVVLGMRGDVAGSIKVLWEGLELSDHPAIQKQLLANLGETLYLAGRFREARATRAKVLLGHGRFSYISLGGYAACCAALGDIDGVKWAAGQGMLVASSVSPSRALAQGLMGCADACGEAGLVDLAKALYDRGRAMADAHGYHDLQFRADPSVPRAPRRTPVPFAPAMDSTLESIVGLAPDGVPTDAVLTW